MTSTVREQKLQWAIFDLRGKWRPRTPRWYNAGPLTTYKVNGLKSEFANFELKLRKSTRFVFAKRALGMHV